jgi:hypothetical protein
MNEIIAALVGGILAAGTGWFLERRRESARLAQARKILTRAICDDLTHSLLIYDKVAEEWEKTKTVWFATTNELKESRQPYLNSKDWIAVFDDEDLRRKIFRYYLQSSDRINALEYQQRRKYEIEGKLNEMIRNIKFRDSSLSHDAAGKMAVGYMESESKEYDNLLALIPETVNKLSQFKARAEDLITQLKKFV